MNLKDKTYKELKAISDEVKKELDSRFDAVIVYFRGNCNEKHILSLFEEKNIDIKSHVHIVNSSYSERQLDRDINGRHAVYVFSSFDANIVDLTIYDNGSMKK